MLFQKKLKFAALLLFIPLLQSAGATRGEMLGLRAPDSGLDHKAFVEIEALMVSHEFDRAERLLDGLLEAGANAAAANFQMGKLYLDHQEWARSAAFLQKSLQARGSNDQAHALLGLAWRQLKRPDDAEKEFLEAVKENPGSEVNVYFAGHQLLLDSKFEAALPYLYRAIDLNPQRSEALRAVAMAQARLGNYGLAESYYRKAIEVTQSSGQADYADILDLGVLLLLGHDPAKLSEGWQCARQAVKLQPASADAHYLAGKALFKLRRIQEAVPELVEASKLNPHDSKPHFLLAQAFDRLGQHEKAHQERDTLAALQRRVVRAGIATGIPLPAFPE